jgi:hypothetical protein
MGWATTLAELERLVPLVCIPDSEGLFQGVPLMPLRRPPASAQELEGLERRLGVKLPESYRSFLSTSNGWGTLDTFIPAILTTSEVDWLAARMPEWLNQEKPGSPVTDAEYFDYGPLQAPECYRSKYLRKCLQVSDWGDGAMLLLNPEVKTTGGEWEARMFANWLPGARRFRTFGDLMEFQIEGLRSAAGVT